MVVALVFLFIVLVVTYQLMRAINAKFVWSYTGMALGSVVLPAEIFDLDPGIA
ncbi:MAG: hypothetical protein ACPGYT_01290 [Nitrospirales bacterium]